MQSTTVDTVVAGWRAGLESVDGYDSPAGPLYVGGAATEAGLVDGADLTAALETASDSCFPRPLCC